MPFTARDLIRESAQEIGVVGAGGALGAADADFLLQKFNRLLDNWNADRAAVYASAFNTYTLVPDLSPHTIGPTGATFTLAVRPVSVVSAQLILTDSSPNVNTPITIRDAAWWADQAVPSLETTFPTDLYYQPDWPNGKLFFWPVPQTAYGVQLETRVLLSQVTLNTEISLPPGYRDALTLTLAVDACPAYGRQVPQGLAIAASAARARIFANNDVTPLLATQDSGMPSSQPLRCNFNYLDGMPFSGR